MAERRSLKEGLAAVSTTNPEIEKRFVFGDNRTDEAPPPQAPANAAASDGKGKGAVTRAPLTTRVRADFGAALKRASLERQLAGQYPNTLQDILEEALEPWLRTNGYIG